jgi:hypothetical protein
VRAGARVLYRRRDVDAWLAAHREEMVADPVPA